MLRYSLLLLSLTTPALAAAPALEGQAGAADSGLAPLRPKPEKTVLGEYDDVRRLEVKFRHDTGVRLREGRFVAAAAASQLDAATEAEIQAVDLYLETIGATRHRIFSQSEEWLDDWRRSGEERSGRKLHDLNLFYRIEVEPPLDSAQVSDALNDFDVVAIAYPLGDVSDPVVSVVRSAPAPSPVSAPAVGGTPDFQGQQGYRQAAPLGIDADYGETFSGSLGTGRTICDVETGWVDDHEDVKHKAEDQYVGLMGAPYPWDHGTAVLGELVGEHNGLGVKGIVYDSDILLSSHLGSSSNVPTAIANGAAAIGLGDTLVLEVQCFDGTHPTPFPCELFDSVFATVQTATANGTHVVAAAGNGNNNLDSPVYSSLFDKSFRDSGSILVGASNGSSLDKASFSNYGSRLDAHGWGFNVTSCGYGDLFADGVPSWLREYTASFSGTSSATPIVTGAAVMLNGIHRYAFGSDMDPLDLRDLITQTGTPQGSGGAIGPRPDVREAIHQLGVPRISLAGSTAPGDFYTVTSHGTPGDLFILIFGGDVRANPLEISPYGFLLVESPFSRVQVGTLNAIGEATFIDQVPGGSIPGTSLGTFQGWQRYQSGQPGVGSFANYIPLVVE